MMRAAARATTRSTRGALDKRRKSTFSAQLRTMDAVLGDDARMCQTLEAAEACAVCIASWERRAGITGMDVAGMGTR